MLLHKADVLSVYCWYFICFEYFQNVYVCILAKKTTALYRYTRPIYRFHRVNKCCNQLDLAMMNIVKVISRVLYIQGKRVLMLAKVWPYLICIVNVLLLKKKFLLLDIAENNWVMMNTEVHDHLVGISCTEMGEIGHGVNKHFFLSSWFR